MSERILEGTWEEISRRGRELEGCRVRLTVLDELESASGREPRKGIQTQDEETVFDVLNRAGLIGCIKGAPDSPTDLATNPDHWEDFGRD